MRTGLTNTSRASFQPDRLLQQRVAWHLLAVAVIWALEIFAFQAVSFHFDYPVPLLKQVGSQAVRLLLDLAFSIGLVFVLPRAVTILSFILFILFTQGASYYQEVFGRVLSVKTMQWQFAEGLKGAHFDWSYVNWVLLAALLSALALKVWLLWHAKRADGCQRSFRAMGLAALFGYGLLLSVALWRVDRPEKLRTFVTAERFGMTYGYLPLWASESVFLDMDHLLHEAVAQRALKTDRMLGIEDPVSLTGDVVLIQVESLDWRVLNHRVDGRPVTPFLNRLAEEAMLFKVAAIHQNGSGDADFVMLNAVLPSPTLMTYMLAAYPYQDTLPQLAARAGYTSIAFHGNSGHFFTRKQNFARMGFTRTLFLEEMRDDLGTATSLWGIRDDTVLALSQAMLRERMPTERHLHYIITLTSHQPFIYLEPEHATFLPDGRDILSRFFNNMHFVDRQLEAYLGRLPEGVLVIIFGDHRATVEYGTADDSGTDGLELVPLFIHRVGDRLAERQVSRRQPVALSGELNLVDAASYIHRLFQQAPPPARAAPPGGAGDAGTGERNRQVTEQ